MRSLSLILFSLFAVLLNGQTVSPHGKAFKVTCKTCHSSNGWQLDKSIYSFNHSATKFALTGQHLQVNCRQCHPSLLFSEAKNNCIDCHKDIHQATVGLTCDRCHTPNSWLVNNVNDIHQTSRFPLLGAHRLAECSQCHKSESLLRFDATGINCVDCHIDKYLATTNPNHAQGGIPRECILCHSMSSLEWGGAGFTHTSFPLVQGHSAAKCTDCHKTSGFTGVSTDCISCHQQDFTAAKNPDHNASKIAVTCQDCHSLTPGWKPASFNHTRFPLTLGHAIPTCADCHKGNYTVTSIDCYSCHQKDYTSATNPNHLSAAIPTTCKTCHTTNPGWTPATFNHTTFPLTLGHATPTCNDCHKGNYTTTSTDCFACHAADYNNSTNPNHKTLAFATTCTQCHTTNPGWKPATYTQHDTQFFPIYSGRHLGKWTTCSDCHTNAANYQVFDCKHCHTDVHRANNYSNAQCYSCHPRGVKQ